MTLPSRRALRKSPLGLLGVLSLGVGLAGLSAPAMAQLEKGATAPEFAAPATLAGKAFTFSLADALKKGPVVVYFYPKAFTSGCTIEAHEFANASEQFKAMGAQVIGLSGDDMDTLHKFSTTECGGKFPVASDPDLKIAKSYEAKMLVGYADRVSYLVTPDDKIYSVYQSKMNPKQHVAEMLDALKAWKATQGTAANASVPVASR